MLPGVLNSVSVDNINKTKKPDKITVNALKLDEKTIVIKGYNNENIDNILLDTINLNSQNINTSTDVLVTVPQGIDIIPVTIDVSLGDDVIELKDNDSDIVEYEVVSGDNLSSIADKFNISIDTILWANDLNSKSSINVGQKLVILTVSGLSYKVKSGDTISGLAVKFNVTERDIINFNKTNENRLVIGENIIIPGGKINNPVKVTADTKTVTGSIKKPQQSTGNGNGGSMARPIGAGGVKTQSIHGHNGVDFGAPIGTPVYASLGGVVTLTRGGDAWNGGYGNYIVVKHSNGVQTLYAHLSSILVNKGENVGKGETIAKSGNTGQSTGPHLHFEVRGSKNPF